MKIYYNTTRIGGEAIPTAKIPETPIDQRPIKYSVSASDYPNSYWFSSDGLTVKASDFVSAEIGLPDKRYYSCKYGDTVLTTQPITIKCYAEHDIDPKTQAADLQAILKVIERVTTEPVHFATTDDKGQARRYHRVCIELN